MKELNDKDFDQAFRTRITEELPEFEEESWLKMEKKLRKRDRLIFYRNASIILLFLSFGLGFYLTNQKAAKNNTTAGQKTEQIKVQNPAQSVESTNPVLPSEQTVIAQNKEMANHADQITTGKNSIVNRRAENNNPINTTALNNNSKNNIAVSNNQPKEISKVNQFIAQQNVNQQIANNEIKPVTQNDVKTTPVTETPQVIADPAAQAKAENPVIAQVVTPDVVSTDNDESKPKTPKVKRKVPISLAINAGPDFNSTNALIGGKTSVAFGFSVGVGISKRLTLQTGLDLGFKNYNTGGNAYTFNNPIYQTKTLSYGGGTITTNTQATIEQINAACKVLEVPLLASFLLSDNQKRSVSFNAGLSSYFMLKENYVFKYVASANRADWAMEQTNANQHILSVVNLSATYNIKLKNKKMGFGIEPYIKIPLTGIGEGSVPLKSSGVSFKLQYDFNKK